MRDHAPGRKELRPRSRDDEERRPGAALGEGLHEIECGRIRPLQVFESDRSRCERAPARTREVSAAICRRRNSSGGSFGARAPGSGTSTSGATRGADSEASSSISPVFSRSARRYSGGNPLELDGDPFDERMQRRILQELRGGPFDKGVRCFAET